MIHGSTDNEYVDNIRKVLTKLRTRKVTANSEKTRLGLKEMEYVGHLISSEGISFTRKYKRTKKLNWTQESIDAFQFCRAAVSNCQELYFLEDTATPILQTDASDYGVGGYMYMVTNGQVRVIRFFSKSLVGLWLSKD